ncbi:MAG: type II toxin-antitoxin system toxin DNA ADP-ribosyl transferase DarT [Myxococcota bacterium]
MPVPLPPTDPAIFHITHAGNLPSILKHGGLWSDAQRIARGVTNTNIGHLHIKARRLKRVVSTGGGGSLGDYVPFNFCPRSVMLFAVHKGHQDFGGGQADIVHLVSSVSRAVATKRAFAFTDRHAELSHALYFEDLNDLDEVPWNVMDLKYWSTVKEERQAEFLVRDFFEWSAVEAIGVQNEEAAGTVRGMIAGAPHVPPVTIHPDWYY